METDLSPQGEINLSPCGCSIGYRARRLYFLFNRKLYRLSHD